MSIQEAQPQASTPSSTTGSSANSPAASHPPPTPLTPGSDAPYMALPTLPTIGENDTKAPAAANATSTAPSKRKPSRRANTAERRATHNAVERQRRETLNGRFLDLAALLPNLATVRRPSKSAIVNSSIALIHAHRRQRLLGARELRLLRCEGDALRRELNEWRDRAGLPRVEEPARSPEFFALMNAGGDGEGGEGGEGWWAAPGLGEMGEEERRAYELVVRGQQDEEDEGMEGDEEEYVAAVAARAGGGNFGKMGNNNVNNAANNNNNNIALQHIAPRFQQQQQQQQQMSFTRSNGVSVGGGGPALGFDGMPSHPALGAGVHTMYEPNGHPHGASHALPVHPAFDQHHHQSHHSQHHQSQHNHQSQHQQEQQEKLAWGMNNGLYGSAIAQPQWAHQVQVSHGHTHPHAQQHGQQNAQALFTPPGTAGSTTGGVGGGAPSPVNFTLGSGVGSLGHGHVYASPELDDASSVGSVERGGSVGGGSPGPGPHGGSQGSFDMMGMGGVGMYGRKPSLSLDVGAGAGWNGVSSGQLPIPVPVPVSAGGGGGGNGGRHLNAMMMMM